MEFMNHRQIAASILSMTSDIERELDSLYARGDYVPGEKMSVEYARLKNKLSAVHELLKKG